MGVERKIPDGIMRDTRYTRPMYVVWDVTHASGNQDIDWVMIRRGWKPIWEHTPETPIPDPDGGIKTGLTSLVMASPDDPFEVIAERAREYMAAVEQSRLHAGGLSGAT